LINGSSIHELQKHYSSGKLTCIAVVNHYLSEISSKQHLNAFVEVYTEEARQRASFLDRLPPDSPKGRLHGVVIGLKDNICYAGHKVEASSSILKDYVSPYSATVVERLLAEGAIIIGRLNCDEFAMGSTNENSVHGPALNPVDERRVPGGSSGGAAAAVKANLCQAALGSSTGGSIRQPAAFCGTIGLKPTYGRVSRYGLIAYGSSLDQIGPITNHIEDAALLLEIIAGGDDFDATATPLEVPKYTKSQKNDGPFRIAYYPEAIEHPGLDPEIQTKAYQVLDQLKEQGHTVSPVSFDLIDYLVPTYYIICTAEASSNLSRFDGVRYGYRSPNTKDLESLYKKSRSEGFGKEVQRRIMLGTFVLSSGYYDAYYTKAQQVRRKLAEHAQKVMENHDFLFSPVSPTVAFEKGDVNDDPVAMYLADIYTVEANLTGMPAISLPLHTDEKTGMPIGYQFMANKFDEQRLLNFSNSFLHIFARP